MNAGTIAEPMVETDRPVLAPVVGIALALVGVLTFIAYFAASAFAPEFRTYGDLRENAVSRSAVGFAGLVGFLQALDVPVQFSRGQDIDAIYDASLYIVTPSIANAAAEIDALEAAYSVPTLVVLPKWATGPIPEAPGWVNKVSPVDLDILFERFIQPHSKSAEMDRNQEPHRLRSANGTLRPALSGTPTAIDSLQWVRGPDWTNLLADDAGNGVLVTLRDSYLYVLADPDLLNTHGLAQLESGRLAAAVIETLREGDGPVVFDLTLHGYGHSPNFLRLIFAPPMLGATLCILFAAALMAVQAVMRFGSPRPSERVFAFGKGALADNSAALVGMLRREHRMAGRYAAATRNAVLRAVRASAELSQKEQDELLDRLRRHSGVGETLPDLTAEAGRVKDRRDVLWIARKLYRWRQGVEHGSGAR